VNSRNEASAWHGVNDGGGALLVVERTLATLSVKNLLKSSTPRERLADTQPRPRRLSTDRSTFEGHFSLGCHFHVHFSYSWHAFASHGLPAIAELLVFNWD